VHRDLKPDNIMLAAGGAKVMDFGLASLPSDVDATEETLTGEGAIVGTAGYMSPEQACGKELDTRTDVWSFACVLFEALTSKRAFRGSTVTETLAAVLEREPDWAALPPIPVSLRALMQRCLRKDPGRRLRDIGDARIEMEDLLASQPEQISTAAASLHRRPWLRRAALFAAVGVAAATAIFVGARSLRHSTEAVLPQTVRFTITPNKLARGSGRDIDTEISISQDGKHIAYVEADGGGFWIRDIDQEKARLVPGVTRVYQAFWSADNQWIGYAAGGNLMKIPAQGGTPVPICKLTGLFKRASWSSDGETIVYADPSGLFAVPVRGGSPTRLIEHPHIEHPSLIDLPDGRRAVLYQSMEGFVPGHGISIRVLGEDQSHFVILTSSSNPYPVYSPSGHIIYGDGSGDSTAIWALPFSLARLQPTGKPFAIAQHASSAHLSLTDTLIYSDAPSDQRQLIWCDRSGKTISRVGDPEHQDRPILSPDGHRLAIESGEGGHAIRIYELDRGMKTRFTLDREGGSPEAWTPSGSELTYTSDRDGNIDIFSKPSGGNGEAKLLVGTPLPVLSPDWSPDQRYLVYVSQSRETKGDLFYRERGADGKLGEAVAFLKTPFNEGAPRISPDGRFVVYSSDESGLLEIYVRDFPNGANKWQISAHGGIAPRWSRDGKEIFFVEPRSRSLMAASVASRPNFSSGPATPLFQKASLIFLANPEYDVSADGQRFIVLDDPPPGPPLSIHVVQNWFEEFRGRPRMDHNTSK
jgi:Tol biopolymer transport system component